MTFNATVTNNGPDAAAFTGVGFAFDAVLTGLSVTAPSGWSCDAPTFGSGTTVVSCATANPLANAGTAAFQLTAAAPANEAGNAITMVASVDAETFDPSQANNSASASVNVTATADLGASINGPTFSGTNVVYAVVGSNAGPSGVASATMRIVGNLPASVVTLATPAGWTCAQGAASTLALTCQLATGNTFASGASASFGLTFPRSYNKPAIRLQGQVNSPTTDPNPTNNLAQRRLGMPVL